MYSTHWGQACIFFMCVFSRFFSVHLPPAHAAYLQLPLECFLATTCDAQVRPYCAVKYSWGEVRCPSLLSCCVVFWVRFEVFTSLPPSHTHTLLFSTLCFWCFCPPSLTTWRTRGVWLWIMQICLLATTEALYAKVHHLGFFFNYSLSLAMQCTLKTSSGCFF